MEAIYKERAHYFKAIADETRLKILDILKSGEKCACMLLDELDISQSTLSHHMKILHEVDIVSVRKEGKWSYYTINNSKISIIKSILEDY